MPFSKILIANRGEIACRVIRTARELGYRTVAVYSPADADAPHVGLADEAVGIGGNLASESYLRGEVILEAARRTGADAIHPGYGFLSENEKFAAACAEAGVTFIGPPPGAIAAMGNKRAAKERMIAAGVPCVPGYGGADQSDATLAAEAKRIGLPVMVKAAAGGGGRGMRLVSNADELLGAIRSARSEAENAFGSGELILEKAVSNARHVEIQVFADNHGSVLHLGERDCSVQRRHQKIVEESPSPRVDGNLRQRMGEAAVTAARAVGYRGAGTVEFLLGDDGDFYFLEMNTRLQVEHPVTEMVTGLDLVSWQIVVAQGAPLPLRQEQILLNGHAIEVRLYAEDPYRGFLPQTGQVLAWAPPVGHGVRVDEGIRAGQVISPFYDPMIAKLIAHGGDREEARLRLLRAVEDCVIVGPTTNKHFLARVLRDPLFVSGGATTAFIGQRFPAESLSRPIPDSRIWALAAVLFYERSNSELPHGMHSFNKAWTVASPLKLVCEEMRDTISVIASAGGRYLVHAGRNEHTIELIERGSVYVRYSLDGVHANAMALHDQNDRLFLDTDGFAGPFEDQTLTAKRVAAKGDGRLLAPMAGRIIAIQAIVGDTVSKGQTLIVLEAMKMQHQIVANVAGTVESIAVKQEEQVTGRALLVLIKPTTEAAAAK